LNGRTELCYLKQSVADPRELPMGRLVKRYGNRKLYDTSESRYVTLDEIARWVKAGEDVRILENDTGEDLTAVTFAQIILEEERRKSGLLSLRVLREIIQHGETALQGLAATVDRGMEVIRTAPERAGRRVQELAQVSDKLGQLQRLVDETVRRSVERVTALPAFQKEMRRIERSVRALEARIARLRSSNDGQADGDKRGGV
jgi:polyhydroxyalkanoate synthesis repressor PhaR